MNKLLQEIKSLCTQKRMSAFFNALLDQEKSADVIKLSFLERLNGLLMAQLEDDHEGKVSRLRKTSNLRWSHATLSDFNASKELPIPISKLQDIANCQWIEEFCHLVISGPTGAGKTHLGCAFAQEAILKEYSVLYYHYPVLIRDLKIAEKAGDDTLDKLRRKLEKVRVLFIDDWGIQPLNPQERHLLFELIEMRDQNSSLIITSQYAPADWYDAFGDKTIADSTLDRIVPYATQLNWDLDSYRDKQGRELVKKRQSNKREV